MQIANQTVNEFETVESIEQWSQSTFGPSPSLIVALSRANAELSELIIAAAQPVPDTEKLVMEAADTAICMCRPSSMLHRPIDKIFNTTQLRHRKTSALSLALAANGHMATLMRRMISPESLSEDEAGEYVELIVQKMAELCVALGAHLGRAISIKMPVNRARKWRQTGEGIGQHIEE